MFAVMKPVGANEGYVRRFDATSWCRSGKLHSNLEIARKQARKVWGRVVEVNARDSRVVEDFSLGAIINRARTKH